MYHQQKFANELHQTPLNLVGVEILPFKISLHLICTHCIAANAISYFWTLENFHVLNKDTSQRVT